MFFLLGGQMTKTPQIDSKEQFKQNSGSIYGIFT